MTWRRDATYVSFCEHDLDDKSFIDFERNRVQNTCTMKTDYRYALLANKEFDFRED